MAAGSYFASYVPGSSWFSIQSLTMASRPEGLVLRVVAILGVLAEQVADLLRVVCLPCLDVAVEPVLKTIAVHPISSLCRNQMGDFSRLLFWVSRRLSSG